MPKATLAGENRRAIRGRGENERVVSDKQTHRPRRDDGRAGNAGRGSEMPKNQWSMTVPVAVRFAEWIGQGMLIRIMRIVWRCPSAELARRYRVNLHCTQQCLLSVRLEAEGKGHIR